MGKNCGLVFSKNVETMYCFFLERAKFQNFGWSLTKKNKKMKFINPKVSKTTISEM